MPLIEILALPQQATDGIDRVLRRVSDDVAAAIGSPPHAVWVTWRTVERYAVGADVRAEQPPGSHPPVVHVHARRSAGEIEAICAAVESALTAELGLDAGNVFVTVRPVYALDADVAG